MIYTVGNEKTYDSGISKFGVEYRKLGRVGIWAVYEVDAVWERDTTPSRNGWWHALLVDSAIVRKVIDAQGNAVV